MTSGQVKFISTSHVIVSLAWLGAVASFLVLSISGIASNDTQIARSVYISMNLLALYLIVPLSLASTVTGLILSRVTKWGLFQYYWVALKFGLTSFATVALILHQMTAVSQAAKLAATPFHALFPIHELSEVGRQLVADASLAVLLLFVTTILAIYKPWGLTPYGANARSGSRTPTELATKSMPIELKMLLAAILAFIIAFMALHLAGGGFGPHGH